MGKERDVIMFLTNLISSYSWCSLSVYMVTCTCTQYYTSCLLIKKILCIVGCWYEIKPHEFHLGYILFNAQHDVIMLLTNLMSSFSCWSLGVLHGYMHMFTYYKRACLLTKIILCFVECWSEIKPHEIFCSSSTFGTYT